MRNKRTSNSQIKMYDQLVAFIGRNVLKRGGITSEKPDHFEASFDNWKICFDLEQRVPNSKYAMDCLVTITKDDKTTLIDLEYDCLHWHRKWKDDKKDTVLLNNNISVVRVQTFNMQPNINKLWKKIKECLTQPGVKYYKLPDYKDDVWTGKLFLYYR